METKGKFPKTMYDFPLRCYVLKAIQDKVRSTEVPEFVTLDICSEVRLHAPNMTNHQIRTAISKEIKIAGFIKNVRWVVNKKTMRRENLLILTQKGKEANWKEVPTITELRKQGLTPKPKVKIKKEEIEKTVKEEDVTTASLPTEEEGFDLVLAISNTIVKLQNEIRQWEIKYDDLRVASKRETKSWMDEAKSKENTIGRLNQRVIEQESALKGLRNTLQRSSTGGLGKLRDVLDSAQNR